MTGLFDGVRRDPTMAVLLSFAVAATVLQYGAPSWVDEAILPYTGWVGLAVPYSFLVFFFGRGRSIETRAGYDSLE